MKYCVVVEEIVRYAVYVEAPDEDAAEDAALAKRIDGGGECIECSVREVVGVEAIDED